MSPTNTGATVMKAMISSRRRSPRQAGQAVIEYAFLMVLLATIGVAVLILAGKQLQSTFYDVSFEVTHLTDTTVSGSPTCPDGTPATQKGHKYKCNGQDNQVGQH